MDWKEQLLKILDGTEPQGDFCYGSTFDPPTMQPKLSVQGIPDRIALPLTTAQAQNIQAVAEKAPFGKGTDTVLDESVRKAWQVDPSLVTFSDPDGSWAECLDGILLRCLEKMGIPDCSQVTAKFYKMLLYETGGHFQRHQDSEKESGMFGTMVVQLPSDFDGGALVVHHQKATRTFETTNPQDSFYVTSLYADCEHELQPVTRGWRLCLVYNLLFTGQDTQPSAALMTSRQVKLRSIANDWTESGDSFQGYFLEHKYTEMNLRFQNLKGRDRQVADMIRAAKDEEGNRLFVPLLILMSKHESGSPSYDYDYRRRRGYYSDDEDGENAEMDEVHDSDIEEKLWVGVDGKKVYSSNLIQDYGSLLLNAELDDLFEGDPDDREFEGYMGNYGPTLQYWYYRGVLVFLPWSLVPNLSPNLHGAVLESCLCSLQGPRFDTAASQILQLVESKRHSVSVTFLELLRTRESPLLVPSLKNVNTVRGENMASLLVKISKRGNEKEFESVVEILQKTIRNGHLKEAKAFVDSTKSNRVATDRTSTLTQTLLSEFISYPKKTTDHFVMLVDDFFLCLDRFPEFADVLLTASNQPALKLVLEKLGAHDGASANEDVQKLCRSRYDALLKATKSGPPQFSWAQPKASFPGSQAAEVNAFLRSEQMTKSFHGFNGIGHARNWSNKYFGGSFWNGYSANAVPSGIGSRAMVLVTKTNVAFLGVKVRYKKRVAEMRCLELTFGLDANDRKRRSVPRNKENDDKRTKVEPMCIDLTKPDAVPDFVSI